MAETSEKTAWDVRTFTVGAFYEAGRESLSLTLVAGASGLERPIEEPVVNRPGLALTGFYEHFAWGRLQMIGQGEMAYLQSLGDERRLACMRSLLEHKAHCFVFTGGQQPTADEIRLAEERGAVIMTSPLETRIFAGLSAILLERLAAPKISVYGTMVEVCGLGVLIEGAPGLGKSETALGLVKRGNALVADDLTCLRKEVGGNLLFASASPATSGYMEIRGIGILHVPSIFGVAAVRGEKRLQLVITFRHLEDVKGDLDRVGQARHVKRLLGVDVPNVIIPVSEGRDLVNLVETAVLQQKLLMGGRDPVDELSERLRVRADDLEAKNLKGKEMGNG